MKTPRMIGMAVLAGVLFYSSLVFADKEAVFAIFEPLSGPYAAVAVEHRRGAEMALEEINDSGGVLGSPARLIVRDDELNTGVALRKIKEVIDADNPLVIGGTLSGGMALAINEWACKNDKLYVSFCDSEMGIGEHYCENGFSVGTSGFMQAEAVGSYAFQNLGKTWMIIVADYGWGHECLKGWLNVSKKYNGECLGVTYVPLGTKDISSHLPQIIAKKPDFLVFATYGADLTSGLKQCMEMGVDKKMKIITTKAALPLVKEAGSAFNENVYGTMTFYWKHLEYFPESEKFVARYLKRYNKPPTQDTDRGYTGTKLVFNAMREAGTTTEIDKVRAVLEGYLFNFNKGPEMIRECDHNRTQSMLVVQGKNKALEEWDLVNVVGEVPYWEIMQSCENNRNDKPYGDIALPGK